VKLLYTLSLLGESCVFFATIKIWTILSQSAVVDYESLLSPAAKRRSPPAPLGTAGIVRLLKSNPDIELFHIWNQILAQSYTVCWPVCFFVKRETAVISEAQ